MQQHFQAPHQDAVVTPELSATEADLAFLQEFLGEHLEVDEPSFAPEHLMDPLLTDNRCVTQPEGGTVRERTLRDPCNTQCSAMIASTLCSNLAGLLPSQWDRDLPPLPGFQESFPDHQQEHPLQQQRQFPPEQRQQQYSVPEQPRESAIVVCAFSDKVMAPKATLRSAQNAGLCVHSGMQGSDMA